MAYRVLEVTLISAKDLKKVTVFSKMRVYAVASISGGDPRTPTHRTHSDRQGGRSPMWHAPLRFPIPAAADPRGLALHVLLRAERSFGDRDVGEVLVPVQDLVAAAPPAGENRHLSYQVRSPLSGRKRGVLHISYSLTDAPATAAPAPGDARYALQQLQSAAAKGDAVTAYPPSYHQPQHAVPAPYVYQHHPYGYGPSYGYGPAAAAPYGYGAPSAAPARHEDSGSGGIGSGFGMGLLGAAVGGMMLGIGDGVGDVIADSEMGVDGCC